MYDKKILAKGTAASFGVVVLVLMIVVSSGMAFAAPMAGIGGFTIKADKITGDNFILYPGITDSSEREEMPAAVAEFTNIKIEGLKLYKTFKGIPFIGGNARVVVTSSGTVKGDSVLTKQYLIKAEQSTFNGLLMDERPAPTPRKQFQMFAPSTYDQRTMGMDKLTTGRIIDLKNYENQPGIVLKNVTIKATYLAANEMHIPGMTLAVKYDANGDGDYTDENDITLG